MSVAILAASIAERLPVGTTALDALDRFGLDARLAPRDVEGLAEVTVTATSPTRRTRAWFCLRPATLLGGPSGPAFSRLVLWAIAREELRVRHGYSTPMAASAANAVVDLVLAIRGPFADATVSERARWSRMARQSAEEWRAAS